MSQGSGLYGGEPILRIDLAVLKDQLAAREKRMREVAEEINRFSYVCAYKDCCHAFCQQVRTWRAKLLEGLDAT